MPATVEVRLIADDLAGTMQEMRVWLDHRKVVPRVFRQATRPGGLGVQVEFEKPSEAAEFAGRFGGRILGARVM